MTSARLSFLFSSIGHFYVHMFMAFFAIAVVTMADEALWQMPYEELLRLWTLGALMLGLGAIPAGRLGDRWSAPAMMAVYFLGLGACSILTGIADGPVFITVTLAGLGLFASIYHPVGIPWMIRGAGPGKVGKTLAVNGIFGSFGTAGAGLVAGALIDLSGWRATFILPGIVSVLTGMVMLWFLMRHRITDTGTAGKKSHNSSRGELIRVFLLLLISMFIGGVIYHVMQTALPKLFTEQLSGVLGNGAMGVGAVFAFVFILGGIMQIVGGILADRFPLKLVYVSCWFLQILVMSGLAASAGFGIVGFAALAVMVNVAALPAENMMLAHYTPAKQHGLAFGIKFVLAFVAAPVSIELVAWVKGTTGGFVWLFAGVAMAAACVFVLLLALPPNRVQSAVIPAE